MRTTVERVVVFGKNGDAHHFQVYGWSGPEDGFTWNNGSAAGLMLPAPEAPHGFFVELLFQVHGFPDGQGAQRLIVSVNGREIGRSLVRGRSRLAWRVPRQIAMDRKVFIDIEFPDAFSGDGRDSRLRAIAAMTLRIMPLAEPWPAFRTRVAAVPVASDIKAAAALSERVTSLAVADLALRIESLGVNCELGFFQRKCKVEPLGLLRFSGQALHVLVSSIDNGFEGLGEKSFIGPIPDEASLKDWVIYEKRHMLRYHTWVPISEASAEEMKDRESKRLTFLLRKFLEDLANGDKVFVHQDNRSIEDAEIWPLFLAIRRRGPGALLLIGPTDVEHQAGLVEEIFPGLMRGYFSEFDPGAAGGLSMALWLTVCTNLWLLQELPPTEFLTP